MFTLYVIMDKIRGNNITRYFFSNYPNYTINFIISKVFPSKRISSDFSLVLCDSDRSIRLATACHLPTIALSHEENRGESLTGAPWLIESPEALSPDFLNEVYCRHHGLSLTVLFTKRCFLRELTAKDCSSLLLLQKENSDNPAGCFFPSDCKVPEHFLADYIEHQYPFYGYGIYGIFLKKTEEFIGIAGFAPIDCDYTEVGYSILTKWQGQGFASEVLPPLLSFGKDSFDFSCVVTRIAPGNTASFHLAEKNGLKILPAPQK